VPGVLKSLDGRLYARGVHRWLEQFTREWRPDVLDAHFEWPDGVGVWRLAERLGLPYTVTLRGWLYESMKYPRILRQCVEAMQGAAAIISVSNHLAQTAVESGVRPEKIHVIPNGVDTTRFCPRDKAEARRELGLPADARLLVSVAHLGPRKGHRETIHALADLPRDVRLVLVGGDGCGGRDAKALRRLARSLGVEDRLMLVGRQPHNRVPLYFNAADVSVLASWREGCPNVVLESLASGTPVVASDVGHVSAMIENGRNGRIVPPRQVEPLAAAIRELLDRPPSPQMVWSSPAVRSWDAVAADVCGVLRQVVERHCASNGKGERPGDLAASREADACRSYRSGTSLTCR
jgi:glycosyltransferase involved in cell wall biosynthesis